MEFGGMKRKVDAEGRQFQQKWYEESFFILHNGLEPPSQLINGPLETAQKANGSIVSWEFARFPKFKDAICFGFLSDEREVTVLKPRIEDCNQK
ncbi:hypothetical protein EVAR_7201_1 [Eumeta japonica]|uniref:Uncharacterized protein n=1 Tax=Eumeta variegata TaxID=151549 RepID=A0A4C1T257_EUMVA|nr:hypothetical protein EVAR_7201_1 [Eumeta japonica]